MAMPSMDAPRMHVLQIFQPNSVQELCVILPPFGNDSVVHATSIRRLTGTDHRPKQDP
jgi:hypothetical protein